MDLLIHGCNDVTCVHKASNILKHTNPKVNPCEKFHDFACKNKYHFLNEAKDQKINQLHNILLDAEINDDAALKLSKKLYRSCLYGNSSKNFKVFKNKLSFIVNINPSKYNNFNWLQVINEIENIGLPLHIFLGLTIDTNFPNRTLLKVVVPPFETIAVENIWGLRLTNLWSNIDKDLNDTNNFAEKNHNVEDFPVDLVTLKDLHVLCPALNWLEFFQHILIGAVRITPNTEILANINQINRRLQLLSETPKAILAYYTLFKVIDTFIPFFLKYQQNDRKELSINTLAKTFGLVPVEIEYNKQFLSKLKVDEVHQVVKTIADTFLDEIKTNKGVGNNTVINVDKLANITIVVGVTQIEQEDVKLMLDSDMSFVDLAFYCNKLRNKWFFSKLDKNVLMPWHIDPIYQIRYYEKYNTIYLPTSSVSDIMFNEIGAKYINYGSLGPMVSYEFARFMKNDLIEQDALLRDEALCLRRTDPQVLIQILSLNVTRKAYSTWISKHRRERKHIPVFTKDFGCLENSTCAKYLL